MNNKIWHKFDKKISMFLYVVLEIRHLRIDKALRDTAVFRDHTLLYTMLGYLFYRVT